MAELSELLSSCSDDENTSMLMHLLFPAIKAFFSFFAKYCLSVVVGDLLSFPNYETKLLNLMEFGANKLHVCVFISLQQRQEFLSSIHSNFMQQSDGYDGVIMHITCHAVIITNLT